MRVGVQQPGAARGGEVQQRQQRAGTGRARSLRARRDDPGQRGAVHPLGDHHLRRAGDDAGHGDVGVAGVTRRANARWASASSGSRAPRRIRSRNSAEQRLDLQAGDERLNSRAQPLQLVEVGDAAPAPAPGYCTLTATSRPSCPAAAVYLADAGGGAAGSSSNSAKRCRQPVPNCSSSTRCTVLVRHRRRGVLQLGQRLPVRRGRLLGQSRPRTRDSAWPNFIAPPLSSPSTAKSCSAVRALQLGVDDLRIVPGQPFTPARSDPPGHP